jgi:hypothetical protein
MKRTIVFLMMMTAVVLASAGPAAASHFTQNEFMTAESLDPGMTQTGIHFTLADHSKSYYPAVRYGMGAMMEFGVKFGATSMTIPGSDEKLGALIGLDLKYQLVKETEGIPLDLSVDLGYDTTIINSKNASEVTFATIVSKSFALTDRGYKLIPYGGLSMSALYGSLPESNKTFVDGFAGLEWKLSQKFMVLLELKAGDKATGGVGIRFEY